MYSIATAFVLVELVEVEVLLPRVQLHGEVEERPSGSSRLLCRRSPSCRVALFAVTTGVAGSDGDGVGRRVYGGMWPQALRSFSCGRKERNKRCVRTSRRSFGDIQYLYGLLLLRIGCVDGYCGTSCARLHCTPRGGLPAHGGRGSAGMRVWSGRSALPPYELMRCRPEPMLSTDDICSLGRGDDCRRAAGWLPGACTHPAPEVPASPAIPPRSPPPAPTYYKQGAARLGRPRVLRAGGATLVGARAWASGNGGSTSEVAAAATAAIHSAIATAGYVIGRLGPSSSARRLQRAGFVRSRCDGRLTMVCRDGNRSCSPVFG